MKKVIPLLLATMLLLTAPTSQAAPVDKNKAQAAATLFLAAHGGEGTQLVDITASTPYTTFYIFAGTNGKGFVIISADDCVMPILGYSATSTFATENMPANVKGWLDSY